MIPRELIWLSRELGREERHLAMLGEGNTAADAGDGCFWVKASGTRLGVATPGDFVKVRMSRVLRLVETRGLSDEQVMAGLRACAVPAPGARGLPSTETLLHALFLTEGGAKWAAHTHPVGANGILCSRLGAGPFLGSLFPDEIVYCGSHPAVVPYINPGYERVMAVRRVLRDFRKKHRFPPRLVLLVNHGIVALGATAEEALNVTLMAEKWARTLIGTYGGFGGPKFFTRSEAARIDTWPAEHYRRSLLTAGARTGRGRRR